MYVPDIGLVSNQEMKFTYRVLEKWHAPFHVCYNK